MTPEQAIDLVVKELRRAELKHPGYPDDRLRQVAIMVEEAGEALQAALNIIEAEESLTRRRLEGYDVTLAYNGMVRMEENLEAEVVSTAAMALRWLLNRRPLYAQDRP